MESPSEDWRKINIDASRIQSKGLASLSYVMRDMHARIVMADDKRIGDCRILEIECLATGEAIMIAIRRNFQKIIIESDLQLLVHSTNGQDMSSQGYNQSGR